MVYYIHRVLIINTLAEQCAIFQILVSYLFTTYGYGDNEGGNHGARSYPLSYMYSGAYEWRTGMLYFQTIYGRFWSLSISGYSGAYVLNVEGSGLRGNRAMGKLTGFSLRCVKNLYTQRRGCPKHLLLVPVLYKSVLYIRK